MGPVLSYAVAGLAALVAGACLAATGLLQQRAASKRPEREELRLRLIVNLAHNRMWLAGAGAAVVSYAFQAVALALGPLALVQPLITSELIFAIPLSARWHGARLGRREWAAVLAVAGGLVLGIAAAYPQRGDPTQPLLQWVYVLTPIAALVAVAVLLGRLARGPPRASLFALAGATVLALQSALYATTIELLRDDIWQTFSHWQPYALIVASLFGAFLVESAYAAGPLAASMPVMDATLPLVGIALGVALFDEQIRTGALALAGAAVGLALLVAGIVALDTSPLVRREQRYERAEKLQTEHAEQITDR